MKSKIRGGIGSERPFALDSGSSGDMDNLQRTQRWAAPQEKPRVLSL